MKQDIDTSKPCNAVFVCCASIVNSFISIRVLSEGLSFAPSFYEGNCLDDLVTFFSFVLEKVFIFKLNKVGCKQDVPRPEKS